MLTDTTMDGGVSEHLHCHVYHEGVGKKGANNVASLIMKTLRELQLLRDDADLVDVAEGLVDAAGLVVLGIGRAGGGHDVAREPVIESLRPARGHRPLDVAEQDDAVLLGLVLGVMDVGLIKHHGLTVFPIVAFAININKTVRTIRSY